MTPLEELLEKYKTEWTDRDWEFTEIDMIEAMKEAYELALKDFKKVENAYVEDCFFEDGNPVDGRYDYILIPKPKDLQP